MPSTHMPDGRATPPMPGDADAIGWRPTTPADDDLVRRAHLAHRRSLLAPAGWPDGMLTQLCEGQHAMQERHIAAHHPDAEHRAILLAGMAVGRLCVDRGAPPWRIVDLVLVPEAQGRGVGGAVIRDLLREAGRAGVGVDLHVGRDNPRAAALYRRLGFAVLPGPDETQQRMAWHGD